MNRPVGPEIAEALGVILQRRFRSGFYGPLTHELGGVVDSATYPVLSAVERIGPRNAAALGVEIGWTAPWSAGGRAAWSRPAC